MLNRISEYLPGSLKTGTEKVAFLALAGCVSLALVSIAASEILLAVALFSALWDRRQDRKSLLPRMSVMIPLLLFIVWTTLAALESSNVLRSLTITKKFYLLLLVPLVPLIVRGEDRLTWIYKSIFLVAIVSSLRGLEQFAANPHRDLLHRISGFMSQWMTYSGLLMLTLVLVLAFFLCFSWRNHKWMLFLMTLLAVALICTQTRNAWIGAVMGISALFLVRRPRAIAFFIPLIIFVYLLSPSSIKQRLRSGLNPADPNTRNRIELYETSLRMIRDNPWFGVGPKNVSHEALRYRGQNEFPDWMYQHMHNNILQIASESGIPGVLIWLWLMVQFLWDSLRAFRRAGIEQLSRGALLAPLGAIGAWVALMISGIFEYNFGDSEILILFLFIVSAPYALQAKQAILNGSFTARDVLMEEKAENF
jgi:O-antigen ligase